MGRFVLALLLVSGRAEFPGLVDREKIEFIPWEIASFTLLKVSPIFFGKSRFSPRRGRPSVFDVDKASKRNQQR